LSDSDVQTEQIQSSKLPSQVDAIVSTATSITRITEALLAIRKLPSQVDAIVSTVTFFARIMEALPAISKLINQIGSVIAATSPLSDITEYFEPTKKAIEDIYTHTYTSLYKDIDNIKFNENPDVFDPLCIDIIDDKKNIEYHLCNHKDVVGPADLFQTVSKEEAIAFVSFISQYPYLAYHHKTGQQILSELENLVANALEDISDVVLYRGRLWTDNQEMDYTVSEMWQPPFGIPGMGRFNPAGTSYLYLSDSAQTATSELKSVGCRYSIMKICLTRKISILDISKQNCYIFELCHKQKTGNVANPKEYLIPNYIAQCCAFLEKVRKIGRKIEGIKYKSSIAKNGYCYILFNKYRDSFTDEKIIDMKEIIWQ
jgi:hypothetical protein